ncbi:MULTISPECIES: glycoside hydrolase family 88/105 protein [Haloarcula]|uniref:glycoside hydrolase family 88/105 protein n=1 Tax=Haloarcula TaxID=2237 RepID=UPI0023EE114D|nr:glycoside hydrolase family 88 protein [Halomicroarcula sp. XH51]
MTDVPSDLIERVAAHTVARDMESEEWEKGIAILGLLATGDQRFVDAARSLVDRSIETQTSAGQYSYGSLDVKPHQGWTDLEDFKGLVDPSVIGVSVLEFYRRTGDEDYLDSATRQYEFLRDAPRTADGGIPQHKGALELWVDTIYEICPFLAAYGAVTGDEAAFDEAAHQIAVQAKHLQDSHTDLFRHEWREQPDTFPESAFWSRGNGWAAAGILDTLEHLPDDHDDREELVDIFRRLAAAIRPLQDASGYWHNVLDDDQTPLETSGTTMFAYAFHKGYEMGLLEDEAYLEAADRAMAVCTGVVDDDGAVRRVAGPPGGPDAPLTVTSYGQGWFLKAACQMD